MTSTYNQLVKDLQKRIFANIYLLYGEEPFYIDEIAEYMTENILSDSEKAFNQAIMYGRDSSTAAVSNYCKQFPMGGDRQVLILREAQDMDLKKEESFSILLSYFKNPQPTTTLVVCFKYKAPPAKLLKLAVASDKCVVCESKRKYDSEIPAWIIQQVRESGYSISEKAASMLLEFLGSNLEKINNELGKLFINHPKDRTITEDVIEKNIGISKDYNIFEFQKALAKKNKVKANQIAVHFALNPNENSIFKTIPMLFTFFSKVLVIHSMAGRTEAEILSTAKITNFQKQDYMDAYRNYNSRKVQDIISWLRECNIRALGIDNYSTDQGELLRELVFKILH